MKKMIILILIFVISCAKEHKLSEPQQTETIPVEFSIEPILDMDYDVTAIIGTLTRLANSSETEQSFDIQGTLASTTFEDMIVGEYSLRIEVFDHDVIIANGQTDLTIVAGETTTITIALEWTNHTGNVLIEIDISHLLQDVPPRSILFVGNSYTYYNGGVDSILEQLVLEEFPSETFSANNITFGGYTLENHYYNHSTITEINSGNYDMVIFQEQSQRPIVEYDIMLTYADSLTQIAHENNLYTGFFMTWARAYDPSMITDLSQAYESVAEATDSFVAPVGLVFEHIRVEEPDFELYSADESHPSLLGSYTAACTFFATIWDASPESIEYVPDPSIDSATRDRIQELVWDIVEDYQ